MTSTGVPTIDIDQLMSQVREEVQRRKTENQCESVESNSDHVVSLSGEQLAAELENLPGHWQTQQVPMEKESYHINELLFFHDHEFVRNAYRAILKREPDPEGFDAYLGWLRDGSLSKEEILGRMRYSPEGRKKRTRIKGLLLPFVVQSAYRIPLLGYMVQIVVGLLRLPVYIANLRKLDVGVHCLLYELDKREKRGTQLLAKAYKGVVDYQAILNRQLKTKADKRLVEFLQATKANRAELLSKATTRDLEQKADSAELEELAKQKADREWIEERLREKADLSLVENLRREKADREWIEERLREKTDLSLVENLRREKADREWIEERLREKADLSLVENLRREKADREWIEERLREKADQSLVEALGSLKADQTWVEKRLAQKVNPPDVEILPELKTKQEVIAEDLKSWSIKVDQNVKNIIRLKRTLVEQERRLRVFLQEMRTHLPEPLDAWDRDQLKTEEKRLLESYYVSFEDDFRGTREDIRVRSRVYLSRLLEAGAGTERYPILDVGCGRGELLEMLRDEGLKGCGVDLNEIMVKECRDLGLDVVQDDAVHYLRTLKPGSLGALTGLHIIEHLPFNKLIELLDEAARVLKKGGVLILETPNPKNIIVGAADFYIDPTHRNPIHPDAIRYIIESRGFIDVASYFFDEIQGERVLVDARQKRFENLDDYLNVSRDFAVLGYRP